MARSDEAIMTVYDKDGNSFEVGRRNAYDMVQHKGFTFANPNDDAISRSKVAMSDPTGNAHAPRTPRDHEKRMADHVAASDAAHKKAVKVEKPKPAPVAAKKAPSPEEEIDAIEADEAARQDPDEDPLQG